MSRPVVGILAVAVTLLAPAMAGAQISAPAATVPGTGAAGSPKLWIVVGGAFSAVRGDCEACEDPRPYLQAGSFLFDAGRRINGQMDVGAELFWVPAISEAGDQIRATSLMGVAQFRPWESRGFFLKGGMGMALVRNWVIDGDGVPAVGSAKALALTYGAGWVFPVRRRLAVQIFGAQNVATLGDIQAGDTSVANVMINFWSIGAAVVFR